MVKRSKPKARSAKEVKIKAKYAKVCKEIDEEMFYDLGCLVCTSCHINLGGRSWGHSHNLPKGRFKHLELDKKNLSSRCQDWGEHHGCHEKLDNMEIESIVRFKDFDDIMAYRYDNAPEEYNKMIMAIVEAGIDTKYDYHEESDEETGLY
ncbi:hypothetical protein LCGC14_0278690 [marine sediment metagenome]|uniref:Uncharacterized protein n=1 Tax=marine sediment metagenome TaxID=412755 RepID=A0A0F9WHX4_9ZZZZ